MEYKLPSLPYDYNALEPVIDAQTMEIHHTKHHQTYVDKLNEALAKHPEIKEPVESLLRDLDNVSEDIRTAVMNHGGGHINHSLFWQILTPVSQNFSGKIARELTKKYGNFDEFKANFTNAALSRFGSGWTWLVVGREGLEIYSTPNQDSPLMDWKIPILGIDLWEHAYYLKYQNKRADYISAFFNLINWKKVDELYSLALKMI